jgi:hypothetical protein
MKDVLFALLRLSVMAAKLCRRGGVRAAMAENLLLKQQLVAVALRPSTLLGLRHALVDRK